MKLTDDVMLPKSNFGKTHPERLDTIVEELDDMLDERRAEALSFVRDDEGIWWCRSTEDEGWCRTMVWHTVPIDAQVALDSAFADARARRMAVAAS